MHIFGPYRSDLSPLKAQGVSVEDVHSDGRHQITHDLDKKTPKTEIVNVCCQLLNELNKLNKLNKLNNAQ